MGDATKHAILSPSGADRWMVCPGSIKLSEGMPDGGNAYSTEGTDLHEVAAVCLEEEKQAADLVGMEMLSDALLTDDQAEAVQKYVDAVRVYRDAVPGSALKVEEKVPLTALTGEKDAEGTVDALIISSEPEIVVIDAKFGRGVEVPVEHNRQTMMYALGAIEKHDLWEFIKTARLVIVQPRTSGVKEWVVSVEELKAFAAEVKAAAKRVVTEPDLLVPNEKACKFCRAKAKCPAIGQLVDDTMLEGFVNIDVPTPNTSTTKAVAEGGPVPQDNAMLALQMSRIPTIEAWIKSIRAEVERRLLAGEAVPGWKLVKGKKGNRKWDDEDVIKKLFKESYRYKDEEMYDMSLISPAQAEKLIKKAHPKRWATVEEHITQTEGDKSVAPASDPRPAISVEEPTAGFEEVKEEWEDLL